MWRGGVVRGVSGVPPGGWACRLPLRYDYDYDYDYVTLWSEQWRYRNRLRSMCWKPRATGALQGRRRIARLAKSPGKAAVREVDA